MAEGVLLIVILSTTVFLNCANFLVDNTVLLSFFMGFVLGAILGSFSNALIYRIPINKSFIATKNIGIERSACPHCSKNLLRRDLIPIISWICLQGVCRYCGKGIGKTYVLLECVTAILGGCIASILGFTFLGVYLFLILPFLMSFILIFFRYKDFSMLKSLSLSMVGVSVLMFFISVYIPIFM